MQSVNLSQTVPDAAMAVLASRRCRCCPSVAVRSCRASRRRLRPDDSRYRSTINYRTVCANSHTIKRARSAQRGQRQSMRRVRNGNTSTHFFPNLISRFLLCECTYFAETWLSLDINTLFTTSLSVLIVEGTGEGPCQTNLNIIIVTYFSRF